MPLQQAIAPPKKKETGALFKTASKKAEGPAVPDYTSDITTLGRRMRVLEEKNISIRNNIELIENNMLNRHKHVTTEIKAMDSEIMELKRDMQEIKDRLLMLIKELQATAKKADVDVLKKYINMWEPVNFVTKNQVEDIVKEILEKK